MENDLISRSELIEAFRARKMTDAVPNYDRASSEVKAAIGKYAELTRALVFVAPAVDAVEVVRCRECKHWGTGYGGETEHCKVCEYAGYMVGANGYCVYGERKDGRGGEA